MNLKFTCPGCKGNRLEEVMENVTVSSEVTNIDDEGDHDYGIQTNENGELSHFQCVKCGYILEIKDGEGNDRSVTEPDELAEWIRENCPQETS